MLCCVGTHHPAVRLPRDLSTTTAAPRAASWWKCQGQPRQATTKQTLHSQLSLLLCSTASQAASHSKAALGATCCRLPHRNYTCKLWSSRSIIHSQRNTIKQHIMTPKSACVRKCIFCRLDTCAGAIRIVKKWPSRTSGPQHADSRRSIFTASLLCLHRHRP